MFTVSENKVVFSNTMPIVKYSVTQQHSLCLDKSDDLCLVTP